MKPGLRINLLPREIRKKRRAERGLIIGILSLVVLVGGLVFIAILLNFQVATQQTKLTQLVNENQRIQKEIEKFGIFEQRKKEVAAHEEALNQAVAAEYYFHRLFNELGMVVPNNISFEKFAISDQGVVTLDGDAYSHNSVAEFLSRLNDLSLFSEVWLTSSKVAQLPETKLLGSSSTSSSSKVLGVQFQITAKLTNFVGSAATTTGGQAQSSTPQSAAQSSAQQQQKKASETESQTNQQNQGQK